MTSDTVNLNQLCVFDKIFEGKELDLKVPLNKVLFSPAFL